MFIQTRLAIQQRLRAKHVGDAITEDKFKQVRAPKHVRAIPVVAFEIPYTCKLPRHRVVSEFALVTHIPALVLTNAGKLRVVNAGAVATHTPFAN